jgi:hypothetical protein
MFKQSRIWKYEFIRNAKSQEFDLGFLGVKDYLPEAKLPHKSSKLVKLTKEQKKYNHELSKTRIKIENINREIKIFRITKEIRRHKQKKHNLFWNLVGGLVNFKRDKGV